MKKIKGVLITVDPKMNYIREHELNYKDISSFHSMLNCKTFTVASRYIGHIAYDIYLDDEGLMKDDYITSMVCDNTFDFMVGNAFIALHDGEGGIKSLSDEDIENILAHIVYVDNAVVKYSY
jgi:hypothetical protein